MKYIKIYEEFKDSDITVDDIIKVIKNNGFLYTKTIKDFYDHNTEDKVKPVEIDDNGDISLDIDGELYYTKLKYVYKIDY
jgi:hypothetical protein